VKRDILAGLSAVFIIAQSVCFMQEGICFSVFFFWYVVLAGFRCIVPGLAPGIDTVTGAAFPVAVIEPFHIVLIKMLAGLASVPSFHDYHLTCSIPGSHHQVNR